MVFCCDPFEPLSAEEMQESAELVKKFQFDKASQATKASMQTTTQTEHRDNSIAEMEELLVSGKLFTNSFSSVHENLFQLTRFPQLFCLQALSQDRR
jgi:hypothetical protein